MLAIKTAVVLTEKSNDDSKVGTNNTTSNSGDDKEWS